MKRNLRKDLLEQSVTFTQSQNKDDVQIYGNIFHSSRWLEREFLVKKNSMLSKQGEKRLKYLNKNESIFAINIHKKSNLNEQGYRINLPTMKTIFLTFTMKNLCPKSLHANGVDSRAEKLQHPKE